MLARVPWLPGDHEVMLIPTDDGSPYVPGGVRAFADLSRRGCPRIYPVPPKTAPRVAVGEPVVIRGERAESIGGRTFYGAILDFVRRAHPGVEWAIGEPDGLGLRPELGRRPSAAFGYVGARLVAAIAEVVPP
jgi:hypothetical protein